MSRLKTAALAGLLTILIQAPAQAGEGSFGWIYTLDLQPKGTLEFEQRLQLNQKQAGGKYDLWQARTELEYGLTDDIQIAGYVNTSYVNANQNNADGTTGGWLVPGAGSGSYSRSRVDGVSLEAIWRLSNPVIDPIGVGLYGEVTTGPVKDEIEARLLLQSNFLDDRLVLASNIQLAIEKVKWDVEVGRESMIDVLLGASYRVANNWTAGVEYRFHNDFDGYGYNTQTQRGHFFGPNVHYATKDWWFTAAWRYQPKGLSHCWAPGDGECSNSRVWDSHSKNEFMFKFGVPL